MRIFNLSFCIVFFCFVTSVMFSQARISDPEPSEFILLAEIKDSTGWIKTGGQWRDAQNKLIENDRMFMPNRFNNFNAIRIYETTYINKKYFILELNYEFSQTGGSYSWVGNLLLKSGSFSGNYRHYYIFDTERFIIQIDEDKGSIVQNDILYLKNISNVKEGEDVGFSVWMKNMREYSFNTLSFYTQYLKEDSVVRFYVGSSLSASSLAYVYDVMKDYYYECDAQIFFEIFGRWIIK